MRLLCAVPALLLSLSLGTAFAAAPKPVKNPCSLAPVADVSAALKVQLKAGIELDGTCIYNNSKGTAVFILSANTADSPAMAGKAFEYAGKDSVKPVEVVSGVGDEAKLTFSNAGPMSLVFRKGAAIVLVSVLPAIGPGFAGAKPGMAQVGKMAASHL